MPPWRGAASSLCEAKKPYDKKRQETPLAHPGAARSGAGRGILLCPGRPAAHPGLRPGAGRRLPAPNALTVWVLDVGQGDSILLRSPNGKTMLVDAGEVAAYAVVDAAMERHAIAALDVVVATHPHSDHIGGMAKLIAEYPIAAFYLPNAVHTTRTFENMLDALEQANVPVWPAVGGPSALLPWDEDVEVRILSPLPEGDYKDLNDQSVVLRVKYGDTAILLTGDAEAHAEEQMLAALDASLLRAAVLKLGHHGSNTSTSRAFLRAVDPQAAIASLGSGNSYGHPHRETLDSLFAYNVVFYRTDLDGEITVVLDGETVSITTEK